MHCHGCSHWIYERRRQYGDDSILVDYTAPDGKGTCEILNMETVRDFGCLSFAPDISGTSHIRIESIEGAPWERWIYVPCPDCDGRGCTFPDGRPCRRCSGTSKVRRYDDGYVADDTWDHPKEKERKHAVVNAIDPGTVLSPIRALKEGVLG